MIPFWFKIYRNNILRCSLCNKIRSYGDHLWCCIDPKVKHMYETINTNDICANGECMLNEKRKING